MRIAGSIKRFVRLDEALGESCCSFMQSAQTTLVGWNGGGPSWRIQLVDRQDFHPNLVRIHMRKCVLKWDLRLLGSDRGSVHNDHPQFGCGSFALRVDPHLW